MAANDQLPELKPEVLHRRREAVFLVLSGLFLGSLAMLNILGISRFIPFVSIADGQWMWGSWGPEDQSIARISFAVAVGVLPYPITFLCTDFISELYGRRRANFLVWVGLLINLWVVFILWIGGLMPPTDHLDPATGLPPNEAFDFAFYKIRALTFGAVTASMIAYLAAQFCDVYMFHFWKKLTAGKHLWLRNNGSTLISQGVDTVAVILITHFWAKGLPINSEQSLWPQLLMFIATGYVFKLVIALVDTGPFYLGVHYLGRYLRLDPTKEHTADEEESRQFVQDESGHRP